MTRPDPRWSETFFQGLWTQAQPHAWSIEQSQEDAQVCAQLLELGSGDILDCPCGDGRIALQLAANGFRVTGVDLNDDLLDLARSDAKQAKVEIDYRRADMRSLDFDAQFDGAICWWGSLGYGTEAEESAYFAGLSRALRAGGGIVLDTHVHETLFPVFEDNSWYQAGEVVVAERREFDPATSRVLSEWILVGDGVTETRQSSIRIYSYFELTNMLQENGFGDFRAYGSTDLEPFELGSSRLVLAARKTG